MEDFIIEHGIEYYVSTPCWEKPKTWHKRWTGKRHRENGPAVEWDNGTKEWFNDGRRHRLDGPAIIRADGKTDWWRDGKKLPEKEIEKWIRENKVDISLEENQMALKLMWP